MTYAEILKHPFWQKKRLQIFERDNFTCQHCSDKFTTLQVHHKYYTPDTMPWEYPDEALITLCELCHEKEEFIKYINRFGNIYLRVIGMVNADAKEIKEIVIRRLRDNYHGESARRYMADIKILMTS